MYTEIVRNITFSADERVIRAARLRAKKENRSLNHVFREWLCRYSEIDDRVDRYDEIMKKLKHIKLKKMSREEMNAR